MTPVQLAAEYTYDLHSDAEFVGRMADEATVALRHGNAQRAVECLRQAERHVSLVEMRYRDALRQAEAAAEGSQD